jgi:hypothetical protein
MWLRAGLLERSSNSSVTASVKMTIEAVGWRTLGKFVSLGRTTEWMRATFYRTEKLQKNVQE